MPSLAIADAGPLLAALHSSQPFHGECLEVFRRRDLQIVVPTMVVAEVAYLADQRLGPRAEAAFIRSLATLEVEAPLPEEWSVIADMVERFGSLRLGAADAATAVLAERLGTDIVITLDRRLFGAIRSPSGHPFRILPEVTSIHEDPEAYGESGSTPADEAPVPRARRRADGRSRERPGRPMAPFGPKNLPNANHAGG
jgi:predicted nucleic acid-binding protein